MSIPKLAETKPIIFCPYCQGRHIVKKGFRLKKHEKIQIYYCLHCKKKFNPLVTKGKTFPLKVILDSITLYNRFYTLKESADKVSKKYGLKVTPQNISNWLKNFFEYLPFLRLRGFIAKKYDKRDIFVESKMFHSQIYDFKYHRAKTDTLLEEHISHYKFRPLQELLELVIAECPHQIFKQSNKRASEFKGVFNLNKVKITPKNNFAGKFARLVLQSVTNNKLRHEILQDFMLINDSTTVAVEMPVLLSQQDLFHYQKSLGFDVPISLEESEVITGHIDFLQIRNRSIHIMDYKPSAKKEKCIDQLTIYALALSRLTGLRLFHFKCAWFDENDYFEFYPLHVVYKKKKKRKSGR